MMSEKTQAKKIRRSLFIKSLIPDLILVLIVSVALLFTVSSGFYSAYTHSRDVLLTAVLILPALIIMFLGTWSKKSILMSAIGIVILSIVTIAISMTIMPEGIGIFETIMPGEESNRGVIWRLNDVEENYVIYAFLLVIIPIVVFLLSRRVPGLVILLIMGMLSCGIIQFLYREWIDEGGLAASMVVLFGIVAMYIFRCYKQSIYQAKRVRKTAFGGALGFAAIISCLCLVIGLGAFYGVINNLNLTTPEVKPFERLWAAPEYEFTGTQEEFEKIMEDLKSNQTNDDLIPSKNQNEADSGENGGSKGSGDGKNSPSLLEKLVTAFSSNSEDEQYDSIAYHIPEFMKYLIPIIIVALIVAAILLRRYMRKLRLKRLEDKPYSYRVWFIYTFLLDRYRKLKIAKPKYLTPLEYAVGAERVMTPFKENTGGVDFIDVTQTYQDAYYGGKEITATEYDNVVKYYTAFFKNARIHVGNFKWIFKFWRI